MKYKIKNKSRSMRVVRVGGHNEYISPGKSITVDELIVLPENLFDVEEIKKKEVKKNG